MSLSIQAVWCGVAFCTWTTHHSGRTFEAFPLLLALKYLEPMGIRSELGDAATGAMRLGKALIKPLDESAGGYIRADAGGYQFLLDYLRGPMPFPLISLSDVLETKLDPATFRDKVVIVGGTAGSVKDFFHSPFDEPDGRDMVYGIAMHGHIVDQLLRMAFGATPVMRASSEVLEVVVIVLAAVMGVLCSLAFRSPQTLVPIGVLGLAVIAGATWIAFERFVWLPVLPQSTAWILAIMTMMGVVFWREYAERRDLMSLFSRHLSGEIASEIWTRRKELVDASGQPRSQRTVATILFSDIKGFTTIAEELGPREQMDWLNRYMSAMVDVVQKYGGTVNQLIGDAVMAVFGVPISRTTEEEIRQDAINAVECALAMRDALKGVNADNRRLRLPEINIRIGIYTGPVVTGPVGGKDRVQFAIVGDTVNTAARLESLKLDGHGPSPETANCRILIGEDTLNLLGNRYRTECIGVMALKGKNRPLHVFKVEAPAQQYTEDLR
jgi:adenylate cyclase